MAANTLPLTLQGTALPPNVAWTPQQLADFLWSRARIVTSQQYALFASGSTEPSSNVGPWFKSSGTGGEWYAWSDADGGYVPVTIPAESLGYWIGPDAPDASIYNFWIETAAGGEPQALKIYYNSAWTDVYAAQLADYLTIVSAAATYAPINSPTFTGTPAAPTAAPGTNTTQLATTAFVATSYAPLASPTFTGTPAVPTAAPGTNTTQAASTAFVTAAIAAIPSVDIVAGDGIFRAAPSGDQDIVHGGAGSLTTDVDLGTEVFDPDGAFGSNVFTAPATGYYHFEACLQLSVSAGAPTNVDYWGIIVPSSGPSSPMSGRDGTGTAQAFSTGECTLYLAQNDTVKLQVTSIADAACTVLITSGGSYFSGFRVR